MLIAPVRVVAIFPFALHVLAGLGVLYHSGSPKAETDSAEWWTESFINCYRLGPREGDSYPIIAYIQMSAAVVAMAIHFLGTFNVRRISYAVLFAMYAVTQLRLVVSGEGPVSIFYLYSHIMAFATLVLYHDHLVACKLHSD